MTRVAYVNGFSGASGDMFLGALVDLGVDPGLLESRLGALPLPGLRLEVRDVERGGLRARKVTPSFPGREPSFRTLGQVKEALQAGALEPALRREAERVFERLAGAEAEAHGRTAGTVHFHELGAADTLVDVVGTLIGWRELGIEKAWAGPVNLGGGMVTTEHGVFPVPPPATSRILSGYAVFCDGAEGEKTTPTGALLLACLCRPVPAMPVFTLERAGFGAGDREFASRPNCLQILLGRDEEEVTAEDVMVLETNLDDLNPQILGSLTERLLREGAREAYITPVIMKKGRPGHLLTVIVDPGREALCGAILFRETGTLGYRLRRVGRVTLKRSFREIHTDGGTVRVKVASFEGREIRFSPEYEDCRRIAEKTGRPVRDIMESVLRARGE